MAIPEIERTKNTGSGYAYTIISKGLKAHADFDPLTGVAQVEFDQAQNMTSALEEVIETLKEQADIWGTSHALKLRIDIKAGKFAQELELVAPQFGFTGPEPAGEFGSTEQFVRFRAEFTLTS